MKLKKFKEYFINESDIDKLDDDIDPKGLKKIPAKKDKKISKNPVKIPNWNTY